ncbi:hypothetical protein [Alienimonas californiensis]|uniref:Uncharacterized protein n=1 Tax=Alienimonas californiensis TaxID=2527989 RepID=A0A517P4A3_9PLAN|nr:hypothetical protein [Alienimonas californiensis]QDT14200.1 hypothetical protein CA12_02680 [Alienimonas californiensis]
MLRPLPAAAFLFALYWGCLSGETVQAAMVTTSVAAPDATGAAPANHPVEEPGTPVLQDGFGETAGSASSGPVVAAGVALPATPLQMAAPSLTVLTPLPNRCLRPLLYPGGIYRPPRCA